MSLALALPVPMLCGLGWDRFFELSWEEEVQLHDGRVIVVQRKQSYERYGSSLLPYGGTIIRRDGTLSFDAGRSIGVVTQLFKGFRPMFLDQYQGVWYAVLYGGYYTGSRQQRGQDWGDRDSPYDQWAIKLVDGKWVPMSMRELPELFQEPNMMLLYGEVSEHARFNGERVTLADKRAWVDKHPPGSGHVRLSRPLATSPRSPAVRKPSTGESK